MNDRELLELAAKAAGLGEVWYVDSESTPYIGPKYVIGKLIQYKIWNPLTDDGDALRLAVKLKLCFGPNFDGDLAVCFDDEGNNITEPYGDDPYAATRRAIVGAAAEIGKDMK